MSTPDEPTPTGSPTTSAPETSAAPRDPSKPTMEELRHLVPERSAILEVGIRAVFHTVLLFSLYLLTVGHNSPGGGFVGGLVCGSAFVLRYAAGGLDEVKAMMPVRPQLLLGLGLIFSTLAGASGWL